MFPPLNLKFGKETALCAHSLSGTTPLLHRNQGKEEWQPPVFLNTEVPPQLTPARAPFLINLMHFTPLPHTFNRNWFFRESCAWMRAG